MTKTGRKRKQNVTRTKRGQISRAGKDARATALAQQHRAGRLSEWRGTTVGRLLEDDRVLTVGLSRNALHEAAKRFGDSYAAWQRVMGSRRPMAVTNGATPAPEDEARTTKIIAAFEAANAVLQRRGHAIRQASYELACEHHEESWTPPFSMAWHAIEGFKALADHYGLDWQSEDRRKAA